MAKHNATRRTDKRTGRNSRQFSADLPPHVPIVTELFLDPSVSPNAKMAWGLVQYESWRQDGDPWNQVELSFTEMQAKIGLGERALRAAVKEAVEAGWMLSWRRGQGVANAYHALARNCKTQVQEPAEAQDPRAGATMGLDLDEVLDSEPIGSLAAPRKRDIVFDALAEATNSDPHLEGSLIGKEVAKLRSHPDYKEMKEGNGKEAADIALASEIPLRAHAYSEHFGPGIALTAPALVKHWRRVANHSQRLTPLQEAERRLREERHDTE